MYPSVTAILVVHGAGTTDAPSNGDGSDGTERLRRTLDALRAQLRRPDAVVVVACDASEAALDELRAFGPAQIVTSSERLSFGQAVAAGVRVTRPPRDASEMLWLLAQDTVPAPDALTRLVGALEVSPSVAVAGPKVLDAGDDVTIVSLGETITHGGATVQLVENELDQGQHDTVSDVMAVAPAGMLVRHAVWDELAGFDPAIAAVDDALDFCIRARLAGHRVTVVPEAKVAVGDDAVAGASRSERSAARRRRARQARAAQLHRRLVYAPAAVVWLHWLTLVPLAIARSIWRLIAKQPELIGAELAAAFQVAFSGGKIGNARRTLQRAKRVGWASLSPLRLPVSEVRRRNRLRREASAGFYTVERTELNFFGGGGAWVVLASLLVGIGVFSPLLAATSLQGGALLPLSGTVTELWRNVGWIWHEGGAGFAGAADPFAAVLAVLGSLTFWEPSYALVLLWLLALPLATLGGWFAATRLTERGGYRIFASVLWTMAPPLWSALLEGRPTAVIVHLLLPWLFYAGAVAVRSWAAAGVASILLAATLAAAPSLAPALAVLWLVVVVFSRRHVARAVWLVIPSTALFAPLVWQQGVLRGNWLQILADPGVSAPWTAASGWQLASGFAAANDGWSSLLGLFQFDDRWTIWVPVLFVPLAVLALAALFLPGSLRAATMLVASFLGLVTAAIAVHVEISLAGSAAVAIWPGSALSLYWIGIVGAATVCLDTIRRFGVIPAVATGVLALVAVAPVAATALAPGATVTASNGRTLPAFVTASAQQDADLGTLVLAPQPDGGVSAALVRGVGRTLDDRSTVSSTTEHVTGGDEAIAELAGNLVADSGLDAAPLLSELGVRFVLVTDPVDAVGQSTTGEAMARASAAAAALDGNPALAHVGPTDRGTLWRFDGDLQAQGAHDRMPWMSAIVSTGLLIVFAIALLLSVPTAASRRAAEMTPRTVGFRHEEHQARERRRRRKSPAEVADERAEAEAERAVETEFAKEAQVEEVHDAETQVESRESADQGDAPSAVPDGAAADAAAAYASDESTPTRRAAPVTVPPTDSDASDGKPRDERDEGAYDNGR